VNVRFSFPISLTHHHDDVGVGPESRPHPHDLVITVFIGGLGFDPGSGKVIDPRLGPVSLGEIQKLMITLSARYDGKSLDEILGIRPTFPSLALSIRERYLLTWPDVQVSIRCPDEGWEVQT
jgi:hypothetical protein